MKVVLLNETDSIGGAAIGVYRHFKGIQSAGIDIKMLVQRKMKEDDSIIRHNLGAVHRIQNCFENRNVGQVTGYLSHLPSVLDRLPLRFYPNREPGTWSFGWLDNGVKRSVARLDPDLVNLHWIGYGFVPIKALSEFKRPIVWHLADTWAFTGGCHYPKTCLGYLDKCGRCPQLGSERDNDVTRWIWKMKSKYWRTIDLTIVAQSRWMRDCVKACSLFNNRRIEIIPAGLDETVFRPMDKLEARAVENIPAAGAIILMGAYGGTRDPRKGFHLLVEALKALAKDGWADKAELLIFGGNEPVPAAITGLRTRYLGYVPGDSLIRLYNAADVFVCPSTQENFGQTVLESLSCGTPVVAFDIGGPSDMVRHEQNGYLARPFSTDDLARGIAWVLADKSRRRYLAAQARQKVEEHYTIEKVARSYVNLYKEVLRGNS